MKKDGPRLLARREEFYIGLSVECGADGRAGASAGYARSAHQSTQTPQKIRAFYGRIG